MASGKSIAGSVSTLILEVYQVPLEHLSVLFLARLVHAGLGSAGRVIVFEFDPILLPEVYTALVF